MKKTMIAMAVAGVVAAPMASADVSISGVVEQTFIDDDASANGWTATTFNMLNFSASEDLGNGMSAFAKFNFLETGGTTGTTNNGDNVVGLSGDFGTVIAGTMEDFTEGKALSRMTMNGPAGIEVNDNNDAQRTAGGMAYVSPSISGFTVGVAGYAGQSTTGTANLDATDIMVHYVNGPLDIIATQETQDKDSTLTSAAVNDQTRSALGVSYTMGDIKVGILSVDIENENGTEANDNTDIAMRLDYTMGNNVFTVGTVNSENSTGTTDVDITSVEAKHNFSSRTNAYIGFKSHETGSNDSTYVGLVHKF